MLQQTYYSHLAQPIALHDLVAVGTCSTAFPCIKALMPGLLPAPFLLWREKQKHNNHDDYAADKLAANRSPTLVVRALTSRLYAALTPTFLHAKTGTGTGNRARYDVQNFQRLPVSEPRVRFHGQLCSQTLKLSADGPASVHTMHKRLESCSTSTTPKAYTCCRA